MISAQNNQAAELSIGWNTSAANDNDSANGENNDSTHDFKNTKISGLTYP
jgi:hypothetical protein